MSKLTLFWWQLKASRIVSYTLIAFLGSSFKIWRRLWRAFLWTSMRNRSESQKHTVIHITSLGIRTSRRVVLEAFKESASHHVFSLHRCAGKALKLRTLTPTPNTNTNTTATITITIITTNTDIVTNTNIVSDPNTNPKGSKRKPQTEQDAILIEMHLGAVPYRESPQEGQCKWLSWCSIITTNTDIVTNTARTQKEAQENLRPREMQC